ncbi:Biopolymer transport protein ExbB/TolQ [Salinibacillus kushneri]|uniref:Biopolymer transport protein ExbB/TolQ n=1 Tax=Salinibacillus kushneri TaxID=237682 RepID=A0A1I0I8W7_9BACI|nr:MotA/TolQ/ExbB proton channel family protein [Salinibacillus kushneri]SET93204.1 Biopolymer transport protein ExbB/TolQ [Salinibacillus kushneri]
MFDFLPASNDFARMIIVITFVFLTVVTVRVIWQNRTIFTFLKSQLDAADQKGEDSEFWQGLKQQYDRANQKEDNHIDVQAFVEAYMSRFTTPYHSSSILSRIKRIQSSGSTVILIGVFGTFVGLISALSGLDINGANMQSSIQNVLDGIYTAFYTSVCGIAASLLITFVHRNWDAEHLMLQLTLKAENLLQSYGKHTWESRMVDSLSQVKDAITDMHQSLDELDEFSNTMERASNNMRDYNEKFSESTETLYRIFDNLEAASDSFNSRMDHINNQFTQFLQQLENQETSIKSIDESVRGLSGDVSSFVKDTSAHIQQLTSDSKDYMEHVDEKMGQTYQKMADFYNLNVNQLEKVAYSMEQLEAKNQNYITNVGKATETIKNVLQDRSFDQLLQVTKKFAENVMILESHFERLQNQYTQLDQEKQEFMKFYQSQKEELNRLRDEIQSFSSHNEGLRRQFEDMKFGFEQADKSNREFIQQSYQLIRDVKDGLKQSNQDQVNQLKQVMNEFNNQMNDAFRNLDTILTKNLDNSIQKFEQFVSNTNQAIERQFSAVNHYVNNHIESSQNANREVIHAVGDIRNRIDDWDQRMRQSVRTIGTRENGQP